MGRIINRTPHAIHIMQGTRALVTLPAALGSELARVESGQVLAWSARTDAGDIPVTESTWGRITGLTQPAKDVFQVVSVVVAAAALAAGRTLDDLLVPGGQVRDDQGRVTGCSSLALASSALPGRVLRPRFARG